MRIGEDFHVFLDHLSFLILLVFFVVILREVLRALGVLQS